MYPVSEEYRQAMRQPIRQCETGASVYIGVFDRTIPDSAYITPVEQTEYSDLERVLQGGAEGDYATFEPGFFRLDGRLRLLPNRQDYPTPPNPQGWTSQAQADEKGIFEPAQGLTIQLGGARTLPGLTVTFGQVEETVPGLLRVYAWTGNGEEVEQEYTAAQLQPTSRLELTLEQVTGIRLEITESARPLGRARIARVEFGVGYVFETGDILEISETHEESPVSLSLPNGKLRFVLDNSSGRFDLDRDDALTNFLRQGNQVDVEYTVKTGQGVQRIPSGGWRLSSWNTGGAEASFEAEDVFSALQDAQYQKGRLVPEGQQLDQAVREVLEDAGQTGAVGQDLGLVRLPVPVVSHAQALQLLAGLGMARLYADRQGRICLERAESAGQPDLVLEQSQLYQDCTAALQPRLRYVTAACSDPVVSAEKQQLASLDFNTESGTVNVSHELAYQTEAEVEPAEYQVQLTSWAYLSRITGRTGTNHQLKVTLQGSRVSLNKITFTSPAASEGDVLELDNPLLDIAAGQQVLDWVREYYSRRVVRQLHIRGLPEIDCGDRLEYLDGKQGLVTATKLTYNGAFDEVVTVRGE